VGEQHALVQARELKGVWDLKKSLNMQREEWRK
jgi:hypothetical protein